MPEIISEGTIPAQEGRPAEECAFDLLARRGERWRISAVPIFSGLLLICALSVPRGFLVFMLLMSPILAGFLFIWVAYLYTKPILDRVSVTDLWLSSLTPRDFVDWLRRQCRSIVYPVFGVYFLAVMGPLLLDWVSGMEDGAHFVWFSLLVLFASCFSLTAFFLSEAAFQRIVLQMILGRTIRTAFLITMIHIAVRFLTYLLLSTLSIYAIPIFLLALWMAEWRRLSKELEASLPNWWDQDREAPHA